jgi:hypothetical protein
MGMGYLNHKTMKNTQKKLESKIYEVDFKILCKEVESRRKLEIIVPKEGSVQYFLEKEVRKNRHAMDIPVKHSVKIISQTHIGYC